MRPDPALQAGSSRFTVRRALLAVLVLAALAILPAICRGADDTCCSPARFTNALTSASLVRADVGTTSALRNGH